MTTESLAPNLFVSSIEDCLPFYARLGFEKTVSVPHPPDAGDGAPLGFVILKRGDVELMLQSFASIAADVPGLEKDVYRTTLYVTVASLAPIRKALADWPHVVPERTTFYGAQEIIVRDPAGNVVFLAEHHG